MSKTGKIRAWEDILTISTYERGPEDKNPSLLMDRRNPIHPGSSIVYPYPVQETLFNRKIDKPWKAFLVENDYLRVAVLPELGGRLLYVYDKAAGQEAIYHNHVLKWARIGIRGAWVSGGIEWNFPNGHTVTSSSPIDCTIRENADGSVSLLFGDIERISRMRWCVALTLHPDRACFQTEMRLNNRTPFPNRFWFWANSAAPVSNGMEYLSSATKVMTLKDMMEFPVNDGVDISWDKNHVEAQDMFCLNPRLRYVGWYNHDLKRGMINVADRTEARGTKFYTWGNSDDGEIWEQMLTDEDGPYAEMQSGRLPTMGVWEILSPYSEESWKETWYPVRDIGAPSFANEKLAFSLRAGHSFQLGVQAIAALRGARLSIAVGEKTVWEEQVDLEPAAPYLTEIPLDGVKADNAVFMIHSDEGQLLARSIRPEAEPEVEYRGTVKIKADRQSPRAEDQWLNGIDSEKVGDYEQARNSYRRALQGDPDFSPAEVALGVLDMRQGKFSEAVSHFQKVLKREVENEAARFHLGVCRLYEQHFEEASDELKYLLRSRLYRSGAAYLLGGLYLGRGKHSEAIEQLEKSNSQFPWNGEARALLACALRRRGELEAATGVVGQILSTDPLNFLALSESLFLARSTESQKDAAARRQLENAFRDEAQSYLETAAEYAHFGLYQEAYDILSLYNEGASPARKAYPMVDYFLGYYGEKLNRKGSAEHFRDAGKRTADFVFPHRLEAEAVLHRAVEVNPKDHKAAYYLGNLLCSKGRTGEALSIWEEAAGKLKEFSVIHRNIGRVYWKDREQPDAAIRAYQRALAADPRDYKLYFELNRIFLACGLEDRRRDLIESIPEELLENDVIAEMVAAFHTDRQEWDQALDILSSTHFYPWEVYKGVRLLYVDANIGKGISLTRRKKFKEAIPCFERVFEYPRNIGVGEPHHKANAEAYYRIGLALADSSDNAGAEKAWHKAAEESRPVTGDLCYYRARALQRLGRIEEAQADLEQLLEQAQRGVTDKSGDVAEHMYLSGLAHKGLGQTVQAQQDFHIALALNRAHRRCRWQVSGFSGD